MSHLTGLLSKINQSGLKKEIHSGLSDTIAFVKKKETSKRRIIFLSVFIMFPLSPGLTTTTVKHLQVNAEVLNTGVEPNNSQNTGQREEVNKDIDEQVSNLLYLARNYEQSGDFSKAVESYKKVLQIDPQNYKAMNKIAALFIKMNLWNESLGYLKNSLKLKDNYVPSLINLGIVYAKTGKDSEAERSFLRAISLDEDNHSAIFNIAVLYENQGAYDKALGYYKKLKNLGDKEGINGLQRLENKQLKSDMGQ